MLEPEGRALRMRAGAALGTPPTRLEKTRMARSSTPSKTVQELLDHPYVKRALEDPEVRDNAKAAYDAAQAAYDRLRKEGNPAAAVFDDKKLRKELKTTGKSIATARDHLLDKPRKRRRRGGLLLFVLVAAALAIALSEGLRNKVLDALFGAEEEFDYVSTTAPPKPAPAPSAPIAAAAPTSNGGGGPDAETSAATESESQTSAKTALEDKPASPDDQ